MIISDKHRYLFVELPRTATTAIAKELRENYEGHSILYKHATYEDFLRIATDEQKKYFTFSCIRNPLDDVVSIYLKYRHNHRNSFTNPNNLKRRDPFLRFFDRIKLKFTNKGGVEFSEFFLKYYHIPYNRWSELSHDTFNYIISFENLQDDFRKVLEIIGLPQVRPLPATNKTTGNKKEYLSYYTPETVNRAKRIFGPYMKKWGYSFPEGWGDLEVSWRNQLAFRFFNMFRKAYWRWRANWRWRTGRVGRLTSE